jgi:hypothetical protein
MFYQNSAARELPGPFRRWPKTVAASCMEAADRFPSKAPRFLRNIQVCLKELLRSRI